MRSHLLKPIIKLWMGKFPKRCRTVLNLSNIWKTVILLDIKDPAIPLNYAVYLFNQKQPDNAIKQMQNFEIRVQKLRQMPGLDADPDVSVLLVTEPIKKFTLWTPV